MTLAFDGGYPTDKEKGQFIQYLMAFYGKYPKYDAVYPEVAMSPIDAFLCMEEYLKGDFQCIEENRVENEFGIKVPTHLWGGGDTIDREKVCEIFLNKAGGNA